MLYITGDMHGEKARFTDPAYGIEGKLQQGDILLICGDFKFIFDDSRLCEENAFLDELERRPYTILFCDGNHENFDRLEAYPEELWHGGKVHRIRGNLLHLMRGQVFDILGKSFFVMGGGCSFDMDPCIEGKNWWRRETPCCAEYEEAAENLKRRDNKVDYIITHTAPIGSMKAAAPNYASDFLNYFLEWVQDHVQYRAWYYGHLHLDTQLPLGQTVIYYKVLELEI